jgi:hypothetical protein
MTTITHDEGELQLGSLQAKVPESLIQRLRVEAATRGVYPRDIVVEALTAYFESGNRSMPSDGFCSAGT